MTQVRHQSLELQIARRHTAGALRKLGMPINASATAMQMAALIAERTGWPAPAADPAELLAFLEQFLATGRASVAPPPYRPVVRRPMRYDLAMREALTRAAAAQPHLITATSNVITWRELTA